MREAFIDTIPPSDYDEAMQPMPRFQFSLLSLFIVVTISAFLFALIARQDIVLVIRGIAALGVAISFFLRHPEGPRLMGLSTVVLLMTAGS